MCNDTQSNHQLQQEEQQKIEALLTGDSFQKWLNDMSDERFIQIMNTNRNKKFIFAYLKEHGLPLTSVIKGL
jgi:hypothetical protein